MAVNCKTEEEAAIAWCLDELKAHTNAHFIKSLEIENSISKEPYVDTSNFITSVNNHLSR